MNKGSHFLDETDRTKYTVKEVKNMSDTRMPVQKRSMESKKKILDAGFALFCEKGFYKTNTIAIAKRAGVSTGAVYSYFKDKRQIYIAAFEDYLNGISSQLIIKLESRQPFQLIDFVDSWITFYMDLYADSGGALAQLRMMIVDDEEIRYHFSQLENRYFSNIVEILNKNGIVPNNLLERVYTCCILIDGLRQENSAFSHNGLNFDVFKQQIRESVIRLLNV